MKNISEGIKIINDNEFGNGCCIFTSNGHNARLFADKAEIGMVGINIPLPVPSAYHSFGGWKNSIFGDLNIYGPDGVRFYTQEKQSHKDGLHLKNQVVLTYQCQIT